MACQVHFYGRAFTFIITRLFLLGHQSAFSTPRHAAWRMRSPLHHHYQVDSVSADGYGMGATRHTGLWMHTRDLQRML